jgi:3-oxoacyl-[acyl-carrier protein] reductase
MSKTVVITGAGRGIGYETALQLARQYDCKVVALSRNEAALKKLSSSVSPGMILSLPFDFTGGNFNPLNDFLNTHAITRIDALINNAGSLINKPFSEITEADLQMTYHVNVFAPYLLFQHLLSRLKAAPDAHVVNISSMGGFQGAQKFSGLSAYSSSKAALAGLTECLAEELKDTTVKVNCLCLGAVQTEMLNEAFPGYKAPVSAVQMAEFIAHFTLYSHHLMNGKIIPVALSSP